MTGGRRSLRIIVLIGVLGASTAAAALAASAAVSWGTAIEVPGTAALNTKGSAGVGAVACASAGNCAAGGAITGAAFVANEKNGVWGSAVKVQIGRDASLYTMSCPAAGSCAAGGQYTSLSYDGKAFVVSERHGVWGKPIKVPGMKRLNHGDAWITEVSCAKPGFCSAGGSYATGHSTCGDDGQSYCYEAFVVNETKGVWRKAIKVQGAARFNRGGVASVDTVSCWSRGNCMAAGTYSNGQFTAITSSPFVMREKRGVWGKAVKVRLSAAFLADGDIGIDEISCPTARSCEAIGYIDDFGGGATPFLVTEKNGIWRKGSEVPGLDALTGGAAEASLGEISCATARNCTAGGTFNNGSGPDQPFLVTETNGVWGNAFNVPGLAALNVGAVVGLNSISCGTAGSCAVGGTYTDGSGGQQAFVVDETNGVWGNAVEAPGTAALNVGGASQGPDAEIDQIACVKSGSCTAGGFYVDESGSTQAFVTEP
jgi:hypothetical protein